MAVRARPYQYVRRLTNSFLDYVAIRTVSVNRAPVRVVGLKWDAHLARVTSFSQNPMSQEECLYVERSEIN